MKTYITEDILNPSIIRISIEKNNLILHLDYRDTICQMGVLYKVFGIVFNDSDETIEEIIVDAYKVEVDAKTILEWIII